jgi:hypothetical protein
MAGREEKLWHRGEARMMVPSLCFGESPSRFQFWYFSVLAITVYGLRSRSSTMIVLVPLILLTVPITVPASFFSRVNRKNGTKGVRWLILPSFSQKQHHLACCACSSPTARLRRFIFFSTLFHRKLADIPSLFCSFSTLICSDGKVLLEDLQSGGAFSAQPSTFHLHKNEKNKHKTHVPNVVVMGEDPREDFRTNVEMNMMGI